VGYKVALIGVGYWGKRLKGYIEDNERLELKYICDSKSDLNEVWKDKEVKAVVVATPIDTHYGLVKEALWSGKHVLCEKPLAMKVWEIEELREVAKGRGLSLVTEFTYTFSPSINWVRTNIFGELLGVDFSLKHVGRFIKFDVYWLLMTHLLSVVDMFVPLSALWKFESKDIIREETGLVYFNGETKGQLSVSLNYPDKEARFVFYYDRKTVVCNLLEGTVRVVDYERVEGALRDKLIIGTKELQFREEHNLRHAVEHFVDVLDRKKEDNIERAMWVTKIVEDMKCQ